MIRINLSSLAPPKTKRGGKRAAPTIPTPGEGPSSFLLGLIVFALAGAGMYALYFMENKKTDQLNADLAKAIAENQRLAEVKAKYEAEKRKSDNLQRRIKVINDLQDAQKG